MTVSSTYPVLLSADVAAQAAFWTDEVGFDRTFDSGWYVSLRHPGSGTELALVEAGHPTVPAGFRRPATGVIVNVEVDDVDAVWDRLVVRGGRRPELGLRDESFGQRHFVVADPGGVLVDVITEIPVAAEHLDAVVRA